MGADLRTKLAALDFVTAVRGQGLLIGLDLADAVAPAVVSAALEAGFIINAPGPNTLRLAPPLIITTEQLDTFVAALPALYAAAVAGTKE